MLVRLLYASRAGEGLTSEAVDAILAHSRQHNPAQGITGILCHGGDVFMQVLEGGRTAVNALYGNIVRDPRHRDVALLLFEELCERRFAHWTMGQVNFAKINPSILLKYSDKPVLDPYAMSGRAAMALLEELIANASIVGRTA